MPTSSQPPPRRARRNLILTLLFLALALILAAAAFLFPATTSWYSPADQLHPLSVIENTLVVATPVPLAPAALTTCSVVRQPDGSLTLHIFPGGRGEPHVPGLPAHALTPFKSELTTGTVELASIGIAGAESLTPIDQYHPYRFFSPTGAALSTASLPADFSHAYWRKLGDNSPQLVFQLKLPSANYRCLEFLLRDARTHAYLGSGLSTSSGDGLQLHSGLTTWSSRPIELSVRLARLGPPQDLPFTSGSLLRTPHFLANVIYAGPRHAAKSWPESDEITLQPNPPGAVPGAMALLQFNPGWLEQISEVAFLDATGAPLADPYFFHIAGPRGALVYEADERPAGSAPAAQLHARSIRIQLPTDFYTVNFQLPAIPGLPPAPGNNLLDQVVPYAKFETPSQLGSYLDDFSQIRTLVYPTFYAPTPGQPNALEFHNATLGQMLQKYCEICAVPCEFDSVEFTVRQRQPLWVLARYWLSRHTPFFR